MHKRLFLILTLALGTVVAGCAEDARGICEENDCPCVGPGCAANTANVRGLAVDELHLGGLINRDGFRLARVVRADGDAVALGVRRGEFIGTKAHTPGSFQLDTGDTIVVEHVPSATLYQLRILDRRLVSSALPKQAPLVAYRLGYPAAVAAEFEDVCEGSLAKGASWAGLATMAFVIEGERYDAATKTVSATGAEAAGWINLACAGTALAKMKLMGYDPSLPTESRYHTTPEQRQATLKMITADYCGTGRSFTTTGQKVAWNNAGGWLTTNTNLRSEAIWTEDGAVCLDTPRLAREVSGLIDDIAAECMAAGVAPPGPCADISVADDWAGFAEWRTYIYE